MQIPVDVKAVIDEATNIDGAKITPLTVTVFIDESAPGDLQALIRKEFASASEYTRVDIVRFPTFPIVAVQDADMAVIVAGLDERVGESVSLLRDAGLPVMVVTTLPFLACEIAEAEGQPLFIEDLIAPRAFYESYYQEKDAMPASQMQRNEPVSLTKEDVLFMRERMGEWVVEACNEKKLAFAQSFEFVRKPLALDAVHATAIQNAGVGFVVFIPGADMPVMTLNQAKMLLQIAASYGEPMNIERVKELAVVVGGAFALRSVARQIVGVVPAFGWAVKGAIGYSGTLAMGYAAVEYFEADGRIEGLVDVVRRTRNKAGLWVEDMQDKSFKEVVEGVGTSVRKGATDLVRHAQPQLRALTHSAGRAFGSAKQHVRNAAQKTPKSDRNATI